MSYGDRAAEQYEKDQPSFYTPEQVKALTLGFAVGHAQAQGREGTTVEDWRAAKRWVSDAPTSDRDLEIREEMVLDADERRGD